MRYHRSIPPPLVPVANGALFVDNGIAPFDWFGDTLLDFSSSVTAQAFLPSFCRGGRRDRFESRYRARCGDTNPSTAAACPAFEVPAVIPTPVTTIPIAIRARSITLVAGNYTCSVAPIAIEIPSPAGHVHESSGEMT